MDLLRVVKRRNFPFAFREDATNEDIVSAMQGKLCHTVFLERGREHNYPAIVYSDPAISMPYESDSESESQESKDQSQEEMDHNGINKNAAPARGKSLITKWVKTESGAIEQAPLKAAIRKNVLKSSSFAVKSSKQSKLILPVKKVKTQKAKSVPKLNQWRIRANNRAIAYVWPD